MNNLYRPNGTFCRYHPKQKIVGVCPICLNERLIVLASKQSLTHISSSSSSSADSSSHSHRRNLSKIFAFSSFLNFRHRKFSGDEGCDHETSTSQDESFISITFEDNGVASWEKATVSEVSLEHYNLSWNHSSIKDSKHNPNETKSIIEHTKSHTPLRWRKRVGQLIQLIRWRRS